MTEKLKNEFDITELEKELIATKPGKENARVLFSSSYGTLYCGDPDKDIQIPNGERRFRTLERIIGLHQISKEPILTNLLQRIYNRQESSNFFDMSEDGLDENGVEVSKFSIQSEMSYLAGKALGEYSSLEIWAHEHPVQAVMAVVLASSSVFGLISLISYYLMKK